MVHNRHTTGKAPDVIIETAKLSLNFKKCFRIIDCRFYLQPVTDDALIIKQFVVFLIIIDCNFPGIKASKCPAVPFTPVKYCLSAKSGLSAIEYYVFKPPGIVMYGYAPFIVMIADHQVVT